MWRRDRAAWWPSPLLDAAVVVKVKRELLAACMTCPLCRKLLRDATAISVCLHTFCRKCIYEKLMDEKVDCCPICNIDLGCTPVEKLRPDHNLQEIRAKIFPFKGRKVKAAEAKTSISLPIRRKERSISSFFVSTPQVATHYGLTEWRTKVVTRKSSDLHGLCIGDPIKKEVAKAKDRQKTSTLPVRVSKTTRNKRISPMQTHQVMHLKRMLDSSANTAPSFPLELPVCTVSQVAAGVAVPPVLLADASGMESLAQIVEKSPTEVAQSSFVVSKEDSIAETESMPTNTQPVELESAPANIPLPISDKEPPSTVLADGAPEVPRSFPPLGIEWPDGPQFGVMLGSPDVAAQLIKGLDLLLQINPVLTVEAMRSRLVECTKGYHAFGLPRDAWMAKLAVLWDEFSHLHAIEERKQRIQMMILQEEQQLCRLRAARVEIYNQAKAVRERERRASLRVKELQRELQKAQDDCSGAQAEVATLQRRLDGLTGEVLLSKTRIAELRRCDPRSW